MGMGMDQQRQFEFCLYMSIGGTEAGSEAKPGATVPGKGSTASLLLETWPFSLADAIQRRSWWWGQHNQRQDLRRSVDKSRTQLLTMLVPLLLGIIRVCGFQGTQYSTWSMGCQSQPCQ